VRTDQEFEARRDDPRLTRRSLLGGAAAGGAIGGLAALAPSGVPIVSGASAATPAVDARATGRHREYWLSVDSFEHNLVPTGVDQMMGAPVNGSTYQALGFRAYTAGFGRPLAADPRPGGIGPNSGIPGPMLHAQVGDTVAVHLRNNDSHFKWPHSFHVHGWRYTTASDGAWTQLQQGSASRRGSAVPFGQTYTYRYTVPASAVGAWPYHDHSIPQLYPGADPDRANPTEISAELGLFGIIAVTDRHTPRVDREIYLFFHDLYGDDIPPLSQDFDCFNGRAYLGNTPVFEARVGERVRWRIAALGKEFHVFHLHGHRWWGGTFWTDAQILGPSTTLTVEYTEDNPGDWLYHCHVTDHMQGGMMGIYRVHE
jgi:FtsP/CotA-like multicopper oxidase with cupredoxin domain